MENRKTVVAAAFANPIDQKLVTGYLSGLGYDLVEFPVDDLPQADLFLLDVPSARRFGPRVMARKQADEVFLPAMIALGSRDLVAPWLAAGFDNALRLPLTKAALKTDIEILLRLRCQSQELLERGEEKYRAIFEATGTATILVDEDATILAANQECLRSTGYRPEELVGTKWTDHVAPDSLETMLQYHRARRDTPEEIPSQYEARVVDKAGWIRTAFLSVGMVPGTHRSIVSLVDITDRKRAEAELERLTMAIEQTADAILVTDSEGSIQYVNPAFKTVTGYTRLETIGQNPRLLKSGKQDRAFYQELWGTITQGRIWKGRMVNKRKNGELYTEEAIISPVKDGSGRIISFVAVERDITEHLRIAQEQAHLQEQLQQAQKMESIGRLAGGVAHDFNNMLSVILGFGEIIQRKLLPGDPLKKNVEEILKAGRRSADLTRQLLAFSRRQTLQPEVLDLNKVVRNIEKMLRRLIGEDIELELSLSKDLDLVKVDSGQIEQVIVNLVVNARDAMPRGGRLLVETQQVELDETDARHHPDVAPGKYILLAISDTGCGMDKEVLAHIFDPFFTTKEKGKGTGLGLATVYGILKQSGGNIWTYSEPGKGSTFKIYLPVTGDQPMANTREAAREELSGGGERILVVEDEEAVRGLVKEMLSKSGYEVTLAANGGEALLLVEENGLRPDLIVTDVVMPGMSGKVLVERLRRNQPGLKAIFMSGYTDNAIVHHGNLDRGTPFIQKPFTLREIAEKVRALLRRQEAPDEG